jgi:hypothetical protein
MVIKLHKSNNLQVNWNNMGSILLKSDKTLILLLIMKLLK